MHPAVTIQQYLRNTRISFWFASVIGSAAIINLIVFGLSLLAAPVEIAIQYVSDDAFYYLQLAKTFSLYGEWSFDNGVTVTSGFHPLWGYLLSLVYLITQAGIHEFIRYGIALSLLITSLVVTGIYLYSFRTKKTHLLASLAVLSSAPVFIYNAVSVVEWPLSILFGTLYYFLVHRYGDTLNKGRLFTLWIVGFFASLSRVDFGLTALIIFLITLAVKKEVKKSAAAIAGLFGATAGFILTLLHNYVTAGSFVQSSAQVKLYWSQFFDRSDRILHAASLVSQTVNAGNTAMFIGISLVLPAVFFLVLIHIVDKRWRLGLSWNKLSRVWYGRDDVILVVSSIFIVVGYAVLYSFSGGIQTWYTAHLVVPVFIIIAAVIRTASEMAYRIKGLIMVMLLLIILASLQQTIASVYPLGTDKSPWPHQQLSLQAALYSKANNLEDIGSFNAGIPGYFLEGEVINLDGLVNNEIYPYVVSKKLTEYLAEKDIRYIIDYRHIVESEEYQRAYGFDEARFITRLEPIKVFSGKFENEVKEFVIYKVIDAVIFHAPGHTTSPYSGRLRMALKTS